ncbi:hypothetical protein QLX08_002456 [Tetragonisca angustula]|uniref:Uncharacterized protein n=1 Tax=Tetragonisca angustula TaxID=166442 RepID=A0AAW1ADC6_9HYME
MEKRTPKSRWFAGQERWKRNDEGGEKQCCALGTAGHSENKKRKREDEREGGGLRDDEKRKKTGVPLDGRPVASTRANLKAITGVHSVPS